MAFSGLLVLPTCCLQEVIGKPKKWPWLLKGGFVQISLVVLLYNASILEIWQGNFCVINIFRFRHSIPGFPLSLRDFGDFEGGGGVVPPLLPSHCTRHARSIGHLHYEVM